MLSTRAINWLNGLSAYGEASKQAAALPLCSITDEAAAEVLAELIRQKIPHCEVAGQLCAGSGSKVYQPPAPPPAPTAEEKIAALDTRLAAVEAKVAMAKP